VRRAALLACLAACGDNAGVLVDAADDPTAPACAAVFRDNFAETWSGPPNCAGVELADGHATLRMLIPSETIAADLAIAIDLGAAPAPGTYTSQNLATPWSANALHEFEMTSCLYHAGNASVPPGTFRLVLDAIDQRAHGSLELTLYVLGRPYTYCGETNIERVTVTF
jgi:hypothetical protein